MLKSTFTRVLLVATVAVVGLATPLSASHSWGPYHWARTSTSFTLIIINSTTQDWDLNVEMARSDWSKSNVLDMAHEAGSIDSKVRRRCPTVEGKLRICNLTYGYNGWLGVAGISIDINGHIVTGYTKLNDSYLNSSYYYGWRQSVACQELGHNIGLDHQDEDFNNTSLQTCMDYQDPPWDMPNQHDYDQLASIYGHTDSYNSYAGAPTGGGDGEDGGCNAPPGKGCNKPGVGQGNAENGWGISLGRRGQHEKFMRIDPDGTRHITFVTWAEGH